jgi:NAD(P)-dependent dehydrogenase (short-subunit alcohol dehydrogenase family)
VAPEPGAAVSQAQLAMTLHVMATSLVDWAQDLAAGGLLERGGRIFAMTSAGGRRVWHAYGPVTAAKAALEALVRQLALELAPHAITANAICAGVTRTPAFEKIPGHEDMERLALSRNPRGRLTTPEDVAGALVALSEPGCGWISGNVINVDGGEEIVA